MKTTKMASRSALFVASSILLYALCSFFEQHAAAQRALRLAAGGGWELCTSTQVVRECLVVATGKLQTRLSGSVERTVAALGVAMDGISLLPEKASDLNTLQLLVAQYDIRGKRIHDANLANVAIENGVDALLTNNPDHFSAFDSLVRIIPLASAVEAFQ
jgi:predicted nucleic acid-binding protein